MIIRFKNFSHFLYIFFAFLSLNIFFFSTDKLEAKSFNVNNIEISKPFEINFDKNKVIDDGFIKAFSRLISTITVSSDQEIIKGIKLAEIKGMIESFSVKEEKFIDETYYVNLGVAFNKKKIFNYLENKNVFPSVPNRKKFLLFPIIIEEKNDNLIAFSENNLFNNWNKYNKKSHLLEYLLPTEDLEDLNLIKKNYETIEKYNFEEITRKYNLDDSIVTLVFKNNNNVRILSRITIEDKVVLKNISFFDINFDDEDDITNLIDKLKIIYEDHWKTFNRINTSIKLPIFVKLNSDDNLKVSNFEKILNEINLVYDYYVLKFDKNYIYYQIVFNGTPNIFLKLMKDKNFVFSTQNKTWILQ